MCDSTERVKEAVDSMESRYFVEGESSISEYSGGSADKVSVKIKSSGDEVVFPVPRSATAEAVSKLAASGSAAPFGANKETVVDSAVREATQVLPEAVELPKYLAEVPASVVERIKRALVPDAESVEARLHKVNVYGPGGHFASHKDTPRDETQFGTLVVLLPTHFEGGVLTLAHGGERKGALHAVHEKGGYGYWNEKAEDKKKRLDAAECYPTLKWAAFFGDVSHDVGKVASGWRITVTYVLHRLGEPLPASAALLKRAEGVRKTLAELCDDATWFASGAKLAFDCAHLYEEKELAAAEKSLDKATASDVSLAKTKTLKNTDAVLAVAARAAGLDVSVLRLLREGCCGDGEWTMDKMPKSSRGFGKKRWCDGVMDYGITTDEIEEQYGRSIRDTGEYVFVDTDRERAESLFAELEWAHDGYFGNEASTTAFYTRSVIVVEIPPAALRKARPASAPLTQSQVTFATAPPHTKRPFNAVDPNNNNNSTQHAAAPQAAKKTKAAAAAPPSLYPTTNSASSSEPRVIHVQGGRGGPACSKLDGKCDITLVPGQGIQDLKRMIRKQFGKYDYHTMSTLKLVDDKGNLGRDCKPNDLTDGATVHCTYSFTAGNPAALAQGRRTQGYRSFPLFGGFPAGFFF